MRWVGNAEQAAYMKQRQIQNRNRVSKAEDWMMAALASTDHKWTRQAAWGCRLFDFWNAQLGIAIEVDGPEHRREYDTARDRYNYYRSGIVVLRVRNFDVSDLKVALDFIRMSETWQERKRRIRIEHGLPPDAPMKKVLLAVGLEKAHLDWTPGA